MAYKINVKIVDSLTVAVMHPKKVHVVLDDSVSTEYTLCGYAIEEWDCSYDYKDRVTDKPISCHLCIAILDEVHTFKKVNGKWI